MFCFVQLIVDDILPDSGRRGLNSSGNLAVEKLELFERLDLTIASNRLTRKKRCVLRRVLMNQV